MTRLSSIPASAFRFTPRLFRWAFRPAIEFLENRSCPSVFYDFDVVASTDGTGLTELGHAPSINDAGTVAFAATNAGGDGLYVRALTDADVREITGMNGQLGALLPGVQINDNGLVIAVDTSLPGPGESATVRTWNAGSATPAFTIIATAQPGAQEKYHRFQTGISLDNDNHAVFVSRKGNDVAVNYERGGNARRVFSQDAPRSFFPAAAAGDRFVLREGNGDDAPIVLYDRRGDGTFKRTVIADQSSFSRLGQRPGISDDGSIIVFSGRRKGGAAGVFASIATGSGRVLVRVAGGDIDGKANPELGYDAEGKPLFLRTFDFDQAVGVARQSLQPVGESRDSFVISFIATPNAASIANPVAAVTRPLLFTAQQGIWSVRVDIENQLSGDQRTAYHRTSPTPVIQVGDTIAGKTVASLALGDALANAASTADGTPRTQRRGDHQVAFWVQATDDTRMIVRARHLDSDQDGLLDHWEASTGGIDIDQDGAVDLKLSDWGAQVQQRDLFIEISWLADRVGATANEPSWSNQLAPGLTPTSANVTQQLVQMFAAAPALGSGPQQIAAGIALHIDAGSGVDLNGVPFSQNTGSGTLEGGLLTLAVRPDLVYFGKPGSVFVDDVAVHSLDEIKRTAFSQADKWARELAFHYSVLADFSTFTTIQPKVYSAKIVSATANTLTSAVAVDKDRIRVNSPIIISSGAGLGQLRFVTAVSANGKRLTLNSPWSTTPNNPDNPSRFAAPSGSSGRGEVDWRDDPDFGPFPGNDFLVSLGKFSRVVMGQTLLGGFAYQWRTIAHELGHNLGLRHHGFNHSPNDDADYESLMSYAYQLEDPSTVNSYSGATDKVFNDWANLRLDFQTAFNHVGNSFNIGGLKETEGCGCGLCAGAARSTDAARNHARKAERAFAIALEKAADRLEHGRGLRGPWEGHSS